MHPHCLVGIQFEPVEARREAHRLGPDSAIEKMPEIVCGICRHKQHFAPGLRTRKRGRCRHSCLANATLAAEEKYFFGLCEC